MASHPETSTSTDTADGRSPSSTTKANRNRSPISRRRRLLRLVLVIALALLAVRLITGAAGRARLQQASDRVAAGGSTLRFSDFAPPEVAAGENATDFLEAAGTVMAAQPGESRESTLAEEVYLRWREIDRHRLAATADDLALFGRAVDRHQLVLRVVDQGMSRERARFDVYYTAHSPAALDIPNLVHRLHLAGLLRARARLALEDGRGEDAWRDVAQIFRLAGWQAEEMPTMIHNQVAQAVARQGLAVARVLLPTAPPSDEQAARVLAQARRWDPRANHVRVLEAERAAMATTMLGEGGRHLAREIQPLSFDLGSWPVTVYYARYLFGWPFRPWVDGNAAVYVETMSRLIEACEPPAHQRPEDLEARSEQLFESPWWAALARKMLPNLLESCDRRDLLVAELDLLDIALRLEAHRRETGGYPASLDSLTEVPGPDPFSGEAYRYRLEEGAAVVYSVAGNRADDGGTPPDGVPPGGTPAPGGTGHLSLPELHAGDLVWRLGPGRSAAP